MVVRMEVTGGCVWPYLVHDGVCTSRWKRLLPLRGSNLCNSRVVAAEAVEFCCNYKGCVEFPNSISAKRKCRLLLYNVFT
ncbi:hypothetical protein E2562_013443 [Oryza meyeriana var. granulata]|uniref:Uncharacterized protein n=1 Tax=Oryza meyeriana var. granulata TaxID=110450 RepID=A0A6G1EAU5_9ORYZ|nr:hypothetical protein E2562_013443 [Oryza meyeriana var. granulata]